ncbi:MAG TPA: glycosyltransferase [Aestuariivirga sp.]|nr:glycosyltransferase [Aestuariivirga sp.]
MKIAIVVIGRNEGQRLVACLRSLATKQYPVVYVDSGSTDGSIQHAMSIGVQVIALDISIPFTAARARNAGLKFLNEKWPELNYIQFLDGDCTIEEGWLGVAESFLSEHQDVAVVFGRRRESHPYRTIYNRLCDIEWDTPLGETAACGGDAMMRISALIEVKGYRDSLIAAEDSELCLRLREKNWKIHRVPHAMTLHDANIQRFGQWWKRTSRGGFAYAAVFALHRNSPKRIFHRELLRALFWGFLLPFAVLAASIWHAPLLGLFVLYPLQIARVAVRRGAGALVSWEYGIFMALAQFAEVFGVFKYIVSRLSRRETPLMEYK